LGFGVAAKILKKNEAQGTSPIHIVLLQEYLLDTTCPIEMAARHVVPPLCGSSRNWISLASCGVRSQSGDQWNEIQIPNSHQNIS